MNIATRIDSERGCGWRVSGGMYLVTGSSYTGCDRMPLRLDRCPTCDCGIKPARGWTWVDGDALFAPNPCQDPRRAACITCMLCNPLHRVRPCPACKHDDRHLEAGRSRLCAECECKANDVGGFYARSIGRVGLLWVGESFYKTPADFSEEAARLGISRRIHQIPKEYVVGETIVLMAHRKAIDNGDGTFAPGVFMVTRPTHIEYVTRGNETDKELEALVKRGITPVKVVRLGRQTAMFNGQAVPPDYDLARKDL